MGRIVAIDYGRKRCGLAVTDELQIIATGLATVSAHELLDYLKNYASREKIEVFVVGEPKQLNNQPSEALQYIKPFITRLMKEFPSIPVEMLDERFTSRMAVQAMIDSGLKKKDRQDKSLVDTISATILLQSYLESRRHQSNRNLK